MKSVLIHQSIWESSLVIFAYLISCCLIVKRISAPVVVAVSVLFIAYFPPLVYLIYHGMEQVNNDPWHSLGDISSLLLMPWVFPTALTFLARNSKRINVVVAVLFIFFLSLWNFGRTLPEWERNLDWYYRIPEEAIQIGDYIYNENMEYFKKDKHNAVRILVLTTDGHEIYDDDIYVQYGIGRSLRQYMSPVEIDYRSYSKADDIIEDMDTHYDYIVCTNEEGLLALIQKKRYQTVRIFEKACFLEAE